MASSSRLNTGESGKITAKISTLNKSGQVTETITVLSNDPERPKVTLTLSANVVENILPAKQDGQCVDDSAELPNVLKQEQ